MTLAVRPVMSHSLSRTTVLLSWIAQLVAAVILLQTLFFKFSGAAESRFIFSTLGVEPWGRIASGVFELIAALLLLYPRSAALGGLLAMGVMAGAILAHVFVLGLEIQGDGGLLFALALAVFLCGAAVVYLRRVELPIVGCKFA